jgi:hypothetical protein
MTIRHDLPPPFVCQSRYILGAHWVVKIRARRLNSNGYQNSLPDKIIVGLVVGQMFGQ